MEAPPEEALEAAPVAGDEPPPDMGPGSGLLPVSAAAAHVAAAAKAADDAADRATASLVDLAGATVPSGTPEPSADSTAAAT